MEAKKLSGLQPERVFAYFEKLCSIPHGSGNTKMISDYLVSFAKQQKLRYEQDSLNNVILYAPGTCGLEDKEPVIVQGHMDMVCDKDPDCTLDMDREGLIIDHDGEFVFAHGTTLGGDDGIAVAFILALLEDPGIPHPPIEAVITVDEETGMYGAAGIDLSRLQGKRLLNIDSEEEGVFTVACAGGARALIRLPLPRRVVYGPCVRLTVEGLKGGHSGVEIHRKHANAIVVMAWLLERIQKQMPLCITGFSGGGKDNAIPRNCSATLVAMGSDPQRINELTDTLQQQVREQYDEPDAVIRAEAVDAFGANAVSVEDTKRLIALLNAVPNGVICYSEDIPGLVQTSLNLGVAELGEELEMVFAVRSSVNGEKWELLERLKKTAEEFKAVYEDTGDYPAWEYKKQSPLRETVARVYRQQYAKEPQIAAIHAGLECGLFCEKQPQLDCVSFGPNMYDIHTSREKLQIASVQRLWQYLLALLKQL